MESPVHERQTIEAYLRSAEGGGGLVVQHVEKLASEHVLDRQYDVWDARTDQGRWWVITNPTNLYRQDDIHSMDVALSFHIGLMQRVLARQAFPGSQPVDDWVLDVLRRLDLAGDYLERAKEVDDFQAVGARLRETMLALCNGLQAVLQDHEIGGGGDLKGAQFKDWAKVAAKAFGVRSGRRQRRALLESASESAWDYVAWLVHYNKASPSEARSAYLAVQQVVELFLIAISRWRLGDPPRCGVCGSYQVRTEVADSDRSVKVCEVCNGVEEIVSDPSPASTPPPDVHVKPSDATGDAVTGEECIFIEDLTLYITPAAARARMEEMAEHMAADHWIPWANGFAVEDESGKLTDAHRLILEQSEYAISAGSEFVYDCDEEMCVNPGHASESELSGEQTWIPGVVRSVVPRHGGLLEVAVECGGRPAIRISLDLDTVDRLGLADASSLLERVVVLTEPSDDGWANLIVGAKRSSLAFGSVQSAWAHPNREISPSEPCPCRSGEPYQKCHGPPASLAG